MRNTDELSSALDEVKSIPDVITARRLVDLPPAGESAATGSDDVVKPDKDGGK